MIIRRIGIVMSSRSSVGMIVQTLANAVDRLPRCLA
jgi:hypothetical protein